MEAACLIQVASCFSSSLSDSRTSRERTSLYWPMGGTGSSEVPLKKLNLMWCWKAAKTRNQPCPSTPKRAVPRLAGLSGQAFQALAEDFDAGAAAVALSRRGSYVKIATPSPTTL